MMWDLTGNKAKQVSDQTLLNVLMLIMLTCLVWLLTGCEAKQVPHYAYCLSSLALAASLAAVVAALVVALSPLSRPTAFLTVS